MIYHRPGTGPAGGTSESVSEVSLCRPAGDAWLNLGRLLDSNLSLNTTAEQTRPALVGHWLSPSETGICPGSSPGSLPVRHKNSPVAAFVHAGPSCRLAGATVPAPTRPGSAPPPRHGSGPRLPLSGRRTGSDPRPSDLAQHRPRRPPVRGISAASVLVPLEGPRTGMRGGGSQGIFLFSSAP